MTIDGWITVFFPYLCDKQGISQNKALLKANFESLKYDGIDPKLIPKGVSEVPLIVIDRERNVHKMTIFGGFLAGQLKEKEGIIKPAYFWCVAHNKKARGTS